MIFPFISEKVFVTLLILFFSSHCLYLYETIYEDNIAFHKKGLHLFTECASIVMYKKTLRLGCLSLVCGNRESGMVGSACVQCRAFSQELPPEMHSVGPDG